MPKKKTSICQVPQCSEREYAAGVCKKHHEENYVLGCCEQLEDGTECPKPLFAKGRCSAHYFRKRRKKRGESAPPADRPVRGINQKLVIVYTRIPKEFADIIQKASRRRDGKGLYGKSQEILVDWAKHYAA